MNSLFLPALEWILAVPCVGAAAIALFQPPQAAARLSLAMLAALLAGVAALVFGIDPNGRVPEGIFAIDRVSGPMLPVVVFLHLITLLGTAKSRVTPPLCARILLSSSASLAIITCQNPRVLVGLLIASSLIPYWELRSQHKPSRGFALYMAAFSCLLLAGLALSEHGSSNIAYLILAAALLLRGGIVPLHSWVPRLYENATFATALLFILPLVEVATAIRLLLPGCPPWILDASAWVALATAIYGGGMALVQTDMRRLFGFLCVSQTALVLFGVLLHSANSLTAALCLWISTTLSLAGLAFSIRAMEARFGRLALDHFHGYYSQTPILAIGFLITGLASVGFPGTVGFLPMELLFAGSVDRGLGVSFALAGATMLNGIAILRAYFSLFTGCRPRTSIALPVTRSERIGIVLVIVIIFAGNWVSPGMVASRHAVAESLLPQSPPNLHP